MYSFRVMRNILTPVLRQSKKKYTPVGIHARDNQCSNSRMDIYEMRRVRLRKLIDDDFGGRQADFARFVLLAPSQVNRWLSSTAAKIPKINEASARDIEHKCNKPAGWMDSENPFPLLSQQALKIAEIISSLPDVQQAMLINLIETTLEMQRQAQLTIQQS